ncbi:MAG TPA: SH3 domain-containing protein [Pyrinomonadaceae bacterium]|nr:SH3 domain-containing protein [Pyrinomonadaceae bacterium]
MAQTGTVIPQGLNLRATPGGTVIKVLSQGTSVEILEDDGDFLKVSAGGDTGFVAAKFVNLGGSSGSSGDGGGSGAFLFQGNKAVAPDGTVFGTRSGPGIFNLGNTSIADFVAGHPGTFTGLTDSRLRVMSAVSTNEGKLEAINTFDNAFLTFGCFQWTVGVADGAGELPAMVNHLKQANPDVFTQLLGQFGLDIASVNSPAGQPPTGFFSLNGTVIKSAAAKQSQLRTLQMAFRFFQAGKDDAMRQAEIEYAASRIDLFYRDAGHKVRNLFVGDWVSSEFGVALILDEHVNRPGHVPGTLAAAVNDFINSGGASDPTNWGTPDEAKLLNFYIKRRSQTSMTDSNNRAQRIRQAVANGLASADRGSFEP